MSATEQTPVTVLGTGAMGSALAAALIEAGHRVTVWNRTAARAAGLVERGARPAASVAEAVAASPVVVACLYDHGSVLGALDPVRGAARGRTLVNVTTTTPGEARGLSAWADEHGIDYLDGAIMAVPDMIGSREAQVLYSGARRAFERHRALLDVWATSTYDGEDPGDASLVDLAMLSGMYAMFAGFHHGAALAGTSGMSASAFAARQAPFLAAMTESLAAMARVVDGGDYTVPGQSLEFTDPVLALIQRTSEERGVDDAPIAMVRALVRRQVDAGHGAEAIERMYESLRAPAGEG